MGCGGSKKTISNVNLKRDTGNKGRGNRKKKNFTVFFEKNQEVHSGEPAKKIRFTLCNRDDTGSNPNILLDDGNLLSDQELVLI